MERCRFVTSWGGVVRCGDAAYHDGFCRFHFECHRHGEVTERGLINERVEQARRRVINFHAITTSTGRPAA